ncbi:unnamed protein product, partial [Rotaria sp. Silwood1]
LSSELHISIFEYFCVNELIESLYNLNQYFNRLLIDYHLLSYYTLIIDQNNLNILLSAICLQQLKSLKYYDYDLLKMKNPNLFLSLYSLIIFQYATNIREQLVIDFRLRMSQLKSCQIKLSQVHGRVYITSVIHEQKNNEKATSTLEYFDIESKSSLPFIYFSSDILPYTSYLRYFNGFLTYKHINPIIMYKPIENLIHLSKLILKLHSAKFKHLYFLSESIPNLQYLKLDSPAAASSRSFLDHRN